ncbi:hypothetical protein [Pseudonocardia sp.]|uniref:hypothetical protein n=1 Tax=Pseudonocardia sp. TaxID=60912 RepID=UPI002D80945A|nr:hypothetical protein [Pseudonocardia sp.]
MINNTATEATINMATAEPPNHRATSCNGPLFFCPRNKSSITNANGHGAAKSATNSTPRITTPHTNGRRSGRA